MGRAEMRIWHDSIGKLLWFPYYKLECVCVFLPCLVIAAGAVLGTRGLQSLKCYLPFRDQEPHALHASSFMGQQMPLPAQDG
eukprot:s3205_g1.t1